MTANVTVVAAAGENVLAVPNSALRFRPQGVQQAPAAGQRQVWKIAAGKLEPVSVKLGLTDGISTEVVSGDLREGDRVATPALPKGASATPAAAQSMFPMGGQKGTVMSMNTIQLEGIEKIYDTGAVRVHALRNVNLEVEPGRVRGHHGHVGLGQIDPDEHPGMPGPSHGRPVPARRRGRFAAWTKTSGRMCETGKSASSSRASTCCGARRRWRTWSCR